MYKLKIGFQYIVCLFILAFSLQCKNTTENTQKPLEAKIETLKITSKDISQIKYTEYVLSDLAESKTKDWLKFQELLSQIEVLKGGNTSFFKDDKIILKGFINDLKSEVPESLNEISITVRISVLETTLYKLDEALNLKGLSKQNILNNIKDVLIAHNNIILQINKKLEKESQNISKPH